MKGVKMTEWSRDSIQDAYLNGDGDTFMQVYEVAPGPWGSTGMVAVLPLDDNPEQYVWMFPKSALKIKE
jgi:flavin-dependent dehydrogenase